jgi:hypothetical protein
LLWNHCTQNPDLGRVPRGPYPSEFALSKAYSERDLTGDKEERGLMQVEFPIVDYRLFRSFSLNQSSGLTIQPYVGFDTPTGSSVISPLGAPTLLGHGRIAPSACLTYQWSRATLPSSPKTCQFLSAPAHIQARTHSIKK